MDGTFGRIQKELKEIEHDKASGVTAEVVSDNLLRLIGCVPGPKDTPYEGGVFKVDIQLDAQYPFAPPKMKFMTRVWHPNVSSQSGAICLGKQQGLELHIWGRLVLTRIMFITFQASQAVTELQQNRFHRAAATAARRASQSAAWLADACCA
jgi:ubiquitin-protein ligase